MAKPKITRLSDPANPYNQKKTPTGRPQDKPKAKPAVAARPDRVQTTKGPPKSKVSSLMSGLNDKYGGGARGRTIDGIVEGAVTGGKKKK